MRTSALRALTVLLALCGLAGSLPALAADNCERFGDQQYLCGPVNAEDIVPVSGTPWLIASGLGDDKTPGALHLIDSVGRHWEKAYPASTVVVAPDARRFADCTTPPDAAKFSAHGIAIRRTGAARHSLLVINHGREAIEYFEVGSRSGKPQLRWVGCVKMPPDVYLNSVAPLADGGFVTTQFYTPSKGGGDAILAGNITGGVLEWHPGGAVTPIPGTELCGANGIETSDGGRVLYVAAWGSQELVRFDRRGATLKKDVTKVGFWPDNLRWGPDGRLLIAGQRLRVVGHTGPAQMEGWNVIRQSPKTLKVTPVYSADATGPLQGVSVALQVGEQLWLGSFRADRVGILPVPR